MNCLRRSSLSLCALLLTACSNNGPAPAVFGDPTSLWQVHDTADKPALCADITPDSMAAAPEADFTEQCANRFARLASVQNQLSLTDMKAHYAYARGASGDGIWLGSNEDGVGAFPGPGYLGRSKSVNLNNRDPLWRLGRQIVGELDKSSVRWDGKLASGSHLNLVLQVAAGSSTGSGNQAIQGVAPGADFVTGIPISIGQTSILPAWLALLSHLGTLAVDVGRVSTIYTVGTWAAVDSDGSAYGRHFSWQFGPRQPVKVVVDEFIELAEDWAQQGIAEADRLLFVVPAGNDGYAATDPTNQPVPGAGPAHTFYRNPFIYSTMPYLFERYCEGTRTATVCPSDAQTVAAELEKVVLTAVALEKRGLAPYSNWCGVAQDYCLSIPVDSISTYPSWAGSSEGSSFESSAGTSVAAPALMGALALVANKFPSLGNVEVAERLKNTATLVGLKNITAQNNPFLTQVAIDALSQDDKDTLRLRYGLGQPDLKAATEPQGTMGMSIGNSIHSAEMALQHSALHLLSPAFGNALSRGLADHRLMALDSWNAPFYYTANLFVRPQPVNPAQRLQPHLSQKTDLGPFQLQVQRPTRDPQAALLNLHTGHTTLHLGEGVSPALLSGPAENLFSAALQPDSALAAPWITAQRDWRMAGLSWQSQSQSRQQVRWLHFQGDQPGNSEGIPDLTVRAGNLPEQDRQQGQMLAWQMHWNDNLQVGAQWVDSTDSDQLLGLSARGGWGQWQHTDLQALGAWGAHRIGHSSQLWFSYWHLGGTGRTGTGALRSVRDLSAESAAIALQWQKLAGGQVALRLEQPLRTRNGWLDFRLPTSRTRYGQIEYNQVVVDATPDGRELRLQLDYSRQLSERGGQLILSLGRARQPGHNPDAPNQTYASLNLSLPL